MCSFGQARRYPATASGRPEGHQCDRGHSSSSAGLLSTTCSGWLPCMSDQHPSTPSIPPSRSSTQTVLKTATANLRMSSAVAQLIRNCPPQRPDAYPGTWHGVTRQQPNLNLLRWIKCGDRLVVNGSRLDPPLRGAAFERAMAAARLRGLGAVAVKAG